MEDVFEQGEDYVATWWLRIKKDVKDNTKRDKEANKLAKQILQDKNDLLRFTPPETKGKMLWTLCYNAIGFDENKEEAVIELLSWTQSQRDFWEILEHLTRDGSKKSISNGHRILLDFLDGAEDTEYRQMIGKQLKDARYPETRAQAGLPLNTVSNRPVQKVFKLGN